MRIEEILEKLKIVTRRYGMSNETYKTYAQVLMQFDKWYKKDIMYVKKSEIIDYVDYLLDKNKSGSTVNTHYSALRFLVLNVLKRKMWFNEKFVKKPKRLPVYLTQDETKIILDTLKSFNIKHQLLVKLAYGYGLRNSEVIKLKVSDLNLDNNTGFIRSGKGNKDRFIAIPKSIKEDLVKYIFDNSLSNKDYLFSGMKKSHISGRTFAEVVKNLGKKAKLNKNLHPHALRHTFATHAIEFGNKLDLVQNSLGHTSPNTTMVYLHCAKINQNVIESPLDMIYK